MTYTYNMFDTWATEWNELHNELESISYQGDNSSIEFTSSRFHINFEANIWVLPEILD